MHQSDYPHGEAHFPDTAEMVINWSFWQDLGDEALRQAHVRQRRGLPPPHLAATNPSGNSLSLYRLFPLP